MIQRAITILVAVLILAGRQTAAADDWPQWLGPQRDGVWRETGILDKFPSGGPKVRWRTPIGAGYSGPAVADGIVFITDRILPQGVDNPKNPFGKNKVTGKERILALEEATGKILWVHEHDCPYEVSYPLGPRTTPLVRDGKAFTLGTMGDLFCFEVKTGKVIWSKNFPKDFDANVPLWGFSAHPLLDGDKLICIVGGKGSVSVAFHKDTGKEIWRALSAGEPGYCPPMIYETGSKPNQTRQLIIWHPEAVNSLDPETGKVYWSESFRVRAGLTIPTPRLMKDLLFVSSFYNGSMMLKLDQEQPKASLAWKGKGRGERTNQTDGLHAIMTTPFLRDGHIYGVCSYGQLRCLKADTGERVWETLQATGGQEARWGHAFLVPQAEQFFIFNEKGDLLIARLTPKGYEELGRAHIVDPSNTMAGRPVVWTHPAFANKSAYIRNDKEIVCVSLAAE